MEINWNGDWPLAKLQPHFGYTLLILGTNYQDFKSAFFFAAINGLTVCLPFWMEFVYHSGWNRCKDRWGFLLFWIPTRNRNVPLIFPWWPLSSSCERPTFRIKQHTGEQHCNAYRWLCSTQEYVLLALLIVSSLRVQPYRSQKRKPKYVGSDACRQSRVTVVRIAPAYFVRVLHQLSDIYWGSSVNFQNRTPVLGTKEL